MTDEVKTAGGETLYTAKPGVDPVVTLLYKAYDDLTSTSTTVNKAAAFAQLLAVGKQATPTAKTIVAELVPQFFAQFPEQAEQALSTQIDFCEDETAAVRVAAVRGLPKLCGDTIESVHKVADVLAQLLQASDSAAENESVEAGLLALVQKSASGVLSALFVHLVGQEADIKGRVFEHLTHGAFSKALFSAINADDAAQLFFLAKLKDVSSRLSADEFQTIFRIVARLSLFKKPTEAANMVDLLAQASGIHGEFNFQESAHVERLRACFLAALPYFRRGASAAAFVDFFVAKVLPAFATIPEAQALALVKVLAETSNFTPVDRATEVLGFVYTALKSQLPPAQDAEAKTDEPPKISFSVVECLLYAFQALAAHNPKALATICGIRVATSTIFTGQPTDVLDFGPINPEGEQFKARLQALAKTADTFTAKLVKLRQDLQATKPEKGSPEADKLSRIQLAVATTRNINSLVNGLLRDRPLLTPVDKIQLSWIVRAPRADGDGKKGENGDKAKGKGQGKGQAQGQAAGGKGAKDGQKKKQPQQQQGKGQQQQQGQGKKQKQQQQQGGAAGGKPKGQQQQGQGQQTRGTKRPNGGQQQQQQQQKRPQGQQQQQQQQGGGKRRRTGSVDAGRARGQQQKQRRPKSAQ